MVNELIYELETLAIWLWERFGARGSGSEPERLVTKSYGQHVATVITIQWDGSN